MIPRENKNNAYAKFGGTNKEYYGIFRTGLFSHRSSTTDCLETRNLNTDMRFQWENVYWGYVSQFAEQNDLRLSESVKKWTLESTVNMDKIYCITLA